MGGHTSVGRLLSPVWRPPVRPRKITPIRPFVWTYVCGSSPQPCLAAACTYIPAAYFERSGEAKVGFGRVGPGKGQPGTRWDSRQPGTLEGQYGTLEGQSGTNLGLGMVSLKYASTARISVVQQIATDKIMAVA